MGLLIKGRWHDQWYDTDATGGEFVREGAQYRHWITPDGGAGPDGSTGFPAEADRYHLYVSLACPWAHRTLIYRILKGLDQLVSVSVVSPLMGSQGWTFDTDTGSSGDALYGMEFLHQLYTRQDPEYSGRVTVPLLWDKQQQCIVNNESADIIRIFNSAFDGLTGNELDLYPQGSAAEIDRFNARIYEDVNNGVYRAGFATQQQVYEQAYQRLFDTLDELERHLSEHRYLCGARLTEADWRLFTTLVRFDAVYHGHFKCNRQRLEEFPQLSEYVRDLYQQPGIADTVSFEHIKCHYYRSHPHINPSGIIPCGPVLDYGRPHHRDRLG